MHNYNELLNLFGVLNELVVAVFFFMFEFVEFAVFFIQDLYEASASQL